MNRKTITAILLVSAMTASAQNPIIRDQFTADPTARVFNGKVYLYPSHDIPAPEGQRQDWFCMADYHVFSSENLTEWDDHGVIVTGCGLLTVYAKMASITFIFLLHLKANAGVLALELASQTPHPVPSVLNPNQ